ncbi:MAG: ubiquinol-cytochrome c reductase iron-sulfur subunit [Pseudomonadota bacterium]
MAHRRDFLVLATGAMGAVGVAGAVWPFIAQMNPDRSALALATVDVDVSSLEPGQSLKVKWRGKSVFVRYRTEEEVEEARAVSLDDLPDQDARNANIGGAEATDQNRSVPGREAWLVMIGVCTHFGCVPIGDDGNNGEYGGWFCPCHGSHYDTAGRIRKGPAPENLHIPPFEFIADDVLRIG